MTMKRFLEAGAALIRSPKMPAASHRRSISRALFRTVLGPSSNRKPSPAQVVMLPPGRSEASRQATDSPECFSQKAAVSPLMPAPRTATSMRSVMGHTRV